VTEHSIRYGILSVRHRELELVICLCLLVYDSLRAGTSGSSIVGGLRLRYSDALYFYAFFTTLRTVRSLHWLCIILCTHCRLPPQPNRQRTNILPRTNSIGHVLTLRRKAPLLQFSFSSSSFSTCAHYTMSDPEFQPSQLGSKAQYA